VSLDLRRKREMGKNWLSPVVKEMEINFDKILKTLDV